MRSWLVVGLAAALVACGPIRLVEDHDPRIEEGLSAYQQSIEAFIANMADADRDCAAGDAERCDQAAYAANAAFYNQEAAHLSALETRAEALDRFAVCATAARVLERQAARLGGEDVDPELLTAASTASMASGNCTQEGIAIIRRHHQGLREEHREADRLPAEVGAFWAETIGQSIGISLTMEKAKQRGR